MSNRKTFVKYHLEIENKELKQKIEQLEKQNKEMLEAIKASCEYDDSWISKKKYDSNYYEGDPDIERYKIFKKIIKERGEWTHKKI